MINHYTMCPVNLVRLSLLSQSFTYDGNHEVHVLRRALSRAHRMAPFSLPKAVVKAFKEKIDALTVQGMLHSRCRLLCLIGGTGDRLYVGTSTGNLHIYEGVGSSSTL